VASERVERRLTAILAADIAGYSRLMGADEEGTLTQMKTHRRALFDPKIEEHRGRIVKTTGDGLLAEFASVVDAMRCAVDVQRALILAVLGTVHTFVRNHGTARVLIERAVAIDPNSAWAWSRLGWLDNYADRPERAIEKFERALRLSPLDPMNFNNYVGIGAAHEIAHDYNKAVAFLRRGLEERPHAMWIYRNLAQALSGAGRMEEAKVAYSQMLRSYPDLTASKFRQAMVFSPAALDRMIDNLRKLGLPD
jgi:tetratricopeptide (TPR) repeat protein